MILFYDFEMTGLRQNTTPISLGIVSEDGKSFYAEFTDYDKSQCDDWIIENVLDKLCLESIPITSSEVYEPFSQIRLEDKTYLVGHAGTFSANGICEYPWARKERNGQTCKGDTYFIRAILRTWLSQFGTIQFVSDVCHYDFVLLIDLLTNGGTALDLPSNIAPVCHDLNMDIARHFRVSDKVAFDMSREQIMHDLCGSENVVRGTKHNAYYDAKVIKAIWEEVGNG